MVLGGPDGLLGRLAGSTYPEVVMAPTITVGDDRGMEVIRAQARRRPSPRALAIARLIGALYVTTGLCVAYLTLTTPYVDVVTAHSRSVSSENAYHLLGWLTALGLPAICILLGANRILEFANIQNPLLSRRDPLAGLGASLGSDYTVIRDLALPGGRHIGALIVGPPGIVIVGALPRARDARPIDGRWEARVSGDQWVAIENPLDRAARDAEAVRRWLVSDEHGFVVKVYAAVIASDNTVARSSTTAVVDRGRVPAFLDKLPPHRTFSADRRRQVLDRVRSAFD